jgi:transcriptional/translational regulatory protein YebC/TACO1
MSKKNENASISKDENASRKSHAKQSDTGKKVKPNKLSILLGVLIVIVGILIILELITGKVSDTFSNIKHAFSRAVGIESKEGNTTGNINNYGYVAEDRQIHLLYVPERKW